jgi:hypothetical protein
MRGILEAPSGRQDPSAFRLHCCTAFVRVSRPAPRVLRVRLSKTGLRVFEWVCSTDAATSASNQPSRGASGSFKCRDADVADCANAADPTRPATSDQRPSALVRAHPRPSKMSRDPVARRPRPGATRHPTGGRAAPGSRDGRDTRISAEGADAGESCRVGPVHRWRCRGDPSRVLRVWEEVRVSVRWAAGAESGQAPLKTVGALRRFPWSPRHPRSALREVNRVLVVTGYAEPVPRRSSSS